MELEVTQQQLQQMGHAIMNMMHILANLIQGICNNDNVIICNKHYEPEN